MILLRHGQTVFNVVYGATRRDPGVPDPELTSEGALQARAAAGALADSGIALILTSPYRRALQTAQILAGALAAPVAIEAGARERFAFSCDVGSPRSALARAWPAYDFHGIAETWWPAEEEPETPFAERCAALVRRWATDSRWDRIVMVTHWGVIRALTGTTLGNGESIRVPAPSGGSRLGE